MKRDSTIVLAGILCLLASAMLLATEFGPDLGFPVELGAAPIIGIALFALVTRVQRRAGPV